MEEQELQACQMLQMKRNSKKNGKYWPTTGIKKGRSGEKVLGYMIKCKKDMLKTSNDRVCLRKMWACKITK